jgi:hypothetical protein
MPESSPFIPMTTIHEINLRGAFVMQSCDLEIALLHIMLFCIIDIEENTVIKNGFKGMILDEKIKKTIEFLKTYRSDLYMDYKSCFEDLVSIKALRNQMAHCKMMWGKSTSDNMSFEFLEIAKDENEGEKFNPVKMNVEEALIKLNDFRLIILKVVELADILKEDFKIKHPGVLKTI